jgi:hypothetical protein
LLLLLLRGRIGGGRCGSPNGRGRSHFRFRLLRLGNSSGRCSAAIERRGRGRRRFAFAASDRAVDGSSARQERPAQQRRSARVTAKTLFGRVPVLSFVAHLSCGKIRKRYLLLLRAGRAYTIRSIAIIKR